RQLPRPLWCEPARSLCHDRTRRYGETTAFAMQWQTRGFYFPREGHLPPRPWHVGCRAGGVLSRRTCSILPTGAILPFTIFAALCACADSYADVEDDAEEELAIEEDVEAWTPRFGESSYRSPGCNNPLALNAGTYDTSLTVSD